LNHTVAALGHSGLAELVVTAVLALPFIVSYLISLLSYLPDFPLLGRFFARLGFWNVFTVVRR
jgi:hypothetical protein